MALNFETSDPYGLLAAFKAAIDEKKIVTWTYDRDGDFTHTPDQWRGKAWLRPSVSPGRLTLGILPPVGQSISSELYAVYHGRFIEPMLAHLDRKFTAAFATALPTSNDRVAAT